MLITDKTDAHVQNDSGPAHVPTETPAQMSSSDRLMDVVLTSLADSKAEDIVSIDLEGKTLIADCMVIASARSTRHVNAAATRLLGHLKEYGFGSARVEGLQQGDWVLIDSGDVVIHLFRPEVRDFYKLEKMWSADLPAGQAATGQGYFSTGPDNNVKTGTENIL